MSFKIDLDVAGTANSLLFTNTAQEEVQGPWLDDDWGQTVIQQKITRTYIDNENDALLKFPFNFQGGYAIVNKDETNRWDIPRGYAIHPGYSPIYNVSQLQLFNFVMAVDIHIALREDRRWLEAAAGERELGAIQPGGVQAQRHRTDL